MLINRRLIGSCWETSILHSLSRKLRIGLLWTPYLVTYLVVGKHCVRRPPSTSLNYSDRGNLTETMTPMTNCVSLVLFLQIWIPGWLDDRKKYSKDTARKKCTGKIMVYISIDEHCLKNLINLYCYLR